MVKRYVVRIGDTTTHGGTVVEGIPEFIVDGKAVAGVGHLVSCPECKSTFEIVSGAGNVRAFGRNVAVEGMLTSCGAVLLASQEMYWIDVGDVPRLSDRPRPQKAQAVAQEPAADQAVLAKPAPVTAGQVASLGSVPVKVRPMTEGEIAMARTVFKDSIDYGKVLIHKGGLLGMPRRSGNAMTPRGEIYFPPEKYLPDFSIAKDSSDKVWFMHEMVHVWQYQLGYNLVWAGIKTGLTGGYGKRGSAYSYDLAGLDKDRPFAKFNMEQQGALISHYFGSTELNLPAPAPLPLIKNVLSGFLISPQSNAHLPTSNKKGTQK